MMGRSNEFEVRRTGSGLSRRNTCHGQRRSTPRATTGLLREIEGIRPLAYTLAGLLDDRSAPTFVGVETIPAFGLASESNSILEPCYLIHDADTTIQPCPVQQRSGGTKYAIDQRLNRFTVGMKPGGIHQSGILLAGQLGTCTDDSASVEILQLITGKLQQRFVRIRRILLDLRRSRCSTAEAD